MPFPQNPTNPVTLDVERKINSCKTLAEFYEVKLDHHSNFIGSEYLTAIGDRAEKWLKAQESEQKESLGYADLGIDGEGGYYYPDWAI